MPETSLSMPSIRLLVSVNRVSISDIFGLIAETSLIAESAFLTASLALLFALFA